MEKSNLKNINLIDFLIKFQIISICFLMELFSRNNLLILIWITINITIIFFLRPVILNKFLLLFLIISICLLPIYFLCNISYIISISYDFLIFICILIIAISTYGYLVKYKSLDSILLFWGNCGFIISLCTIIESLLKKNFLFNIIVRNKNNVRSTGYLCFSSMGNHIVLALFLSLIFIIFIYFARKKRKWSLIKLFFIGNAIILIGSRTGYLALVIILLVVFFDQSFISIKTKNVKLYNIGKILLITVFIVALLFILRIDGHSYWEYIINKFRVLLFGREKTSAIHRINAMQITLRYFTQLPLPMWIFGRGYGMLSNYLRENALAVEEMSNFYVIDNQWFTLLYNNGLFFVICMIIFSFQNVFKVFKIHKSSLKKYPEYEMIQLFIIIIMFFMFSFDVFTWLASSSLTGLCVGISLYIQKENKI